MDALEELLLLHTPDNSRVQFTSMIAAERRKGAWFRELRIGCCLFDSGPQKDKEVVVWIYLYRLWTATLAV